MELKLRGELVGLNQDTKQAEILLTSPTKEELLNLYSEDYVLVKVRYGGTGRTNILWFEDDIVAILPQSEPKEKKIEKLMLDKFLKGSMDYVLANKINELIDEIEKLKNE